LKSAIKVEPVAFMILFEMISATISFLSG